MKKLILSLMGLTLTSLLSVGASKPLVEKIEPPYWWTGMVQDTLQLMVYGPGIGNAEASINYPGVVLAEQVRLESPDYMILYVDITDEAKPGVMKISFSEGGKSSEVKYELKKRDRAAEDYKGFDASDVLYLIMPDRFARGDNKTTDEQRAKGLEHKAKVDRKKLNARHGGDIAGMRQHLDYIDSLGVTAIWVNPVLTNDMPGGSYHGYSTTDYYNIDPRFGTNEEWEEFVADAHGRGLKVVMDMIFNHSGSNHPWFKNRPTHDWFNFPDKYVQTNYRLSTVYDPYVSDYDYKRTVDGWFVRSMPDLNQRNPHLKKYLIQNSIWWIESSKIDGIRMDTHPYADFEAMAEWIRTVEKEYPNFNIVGECWYGNEGGEAFWQKNSYTNRRGNPELPTVMDFVLSMKSRDAFSGQTNAWTGLNDIYDHLALDYLFPNPQKILTFFDNHDTDRFLLEVPEDLGWWKQAMTFLLTSRGIPQIYYGTELLMHGSKEKGDGYIRLDFPGGFAGDKVNAFTAEGRDSIQNEAFDFLSKVLNWRRGNKTISEGTLKHFMPVQGVYVYERRLGDNQIVVMMNGNDAPTTMKMEQTEEILPYGSKLTDMLTGREVEITPKMTFAPREILILENR